VAVTPKRFTLMARQDSSKPLHVKTPKPPDAADSVVHRPGSSWSRFDLGYDLDVSTLSVIAELDPTGAHGVVEDVLRMFQESLDPMLVRLEQLRAAGSTTGIRFEAHKLYSAAGQIGALRLAAACAAITRHGRVTGQSAPDGAPGAVDEVLDALLHELVSETIRVHRKLRRLLAG
jgi:HPt (histidine-containing phosphotransfer) domain-containing protein